MAPPKRPFANPTPAEWFGTPPSTPYPCKAKHLGKTVPGRGGGRAIKCATPEKVHPHEGQLWLGPLPGHGMRKSLVRSRLSYYAHKGESAQTPQAKGKRGSSAKATRGSTAKGKRPANRPSRAPSSKVTDRLPPEVAALVFGRAGFPSGAPMKASPAARGKKKRRSSMPTAAPATRAGGKRRSIGTTAASTQRPSVKRRAAAPKSPPERNTRGTRDTRPAADTWRSPASRGEPPSWREPDNEIRSQVFGVRPVPPRRPSPPPAKPPARGRATVTVMPMRTPPSRAPLLNRGPFPPQLPAAGSRGGAQGARVLPAWLVQTLGPARPQRPAEGRAEITARQLPAPRTVERGPSTEAEESADLILSHSAEEGTTIRGDTRTWIAAIKGLSGGWRWWRAGGYWMRLQSRGTPKPTVALEVWARRLRDAGASVRIEPLPTITQEHADAVRAEILGDRAERLRDRAARKRGESDAQFKRSQGILDFIPAGQPILVGHHSERHHRRDVEKARHAMHASVDLSRKAERLQERAESAQKRADRAPTERTDSEAAAEFNDRLALLVQKGFRKDVGAKSVRQSARGTGRQSWRMYWITFEQAHRPSMEAIIGEWRVSVNLPSAPPQYIDVRGKTPEQAYRVLVDRMNAKMARHDAR